jgi:hypothetical protein
MHEPSRIAAAPQLAVSTQPRHAGASLLSTQAAGQKGQRIARSAPRKLSRAVCSAFESKPGTEGGWERVGWNKPHDTATIPRIMARLDIFISWSGTRSHAAAVALHHWFPQVVNAFSPWLSSEIRKGARWRAELAEKLDDATVGIICLTHQQPRLSVDPFRSGCYFESSRKNVRVHIPH